VDLSGNNIAAGKHRAHRAYRALLAVCLFWPLARRETANRPCLCTFAPLLHILVHNQATMPRGSGSGWIRPEDREAIDNAETVGNDIEISEAHQANVKETNDLERRLKTKREHCNRINRFILWVEEGYPEYVSVGGVKNLLEEELANPDIVDFIAMEVWTSKIYYQKRVRKVVRTCFFSFLSGIWNLLK